MVVLRDAVVGRDAELAAIDAFLTRDGGPQRVLVLEGEPGIGKSTLWRAAVETAAGLGLRVLRAEPAESEAKLSYAALDDLIGPVYDEFRSGLPEPQRAALDVALLKSGGDANARTIGSALVSGLTVLASGHSVVIAIDDAQWLDRASARVLEFTARRLPPGVLLLLARRPDSAPLDLPDADLVRVPVGSLSLGALHQVLLANLGSAPTRPTLVRITETSGGNPFFALAIARALDEQEDGSGPLPVPASLRELVQVRLGTLSAAAREATIVASLLFAPTVGAVGATREALDEAEEAGVLVVERDRIRFTHPLLASVVYASIPGARRLELHRKLADLVADPEERAHHLALSTSGPDESIAAEIEAAAAIAARRGAQDAAADLFRAAERIGADDAVEVRVRRLLGEAAALHAAGSTGQARIVAEQAAAAAPPGRLRAEALSELSQISWVDRGELGPLDYLRLALAESGDDRRLRGRIHAKLGMYSDADQRQAVEHSEAAIELLDEDADPGLLAYSLLAVLFFGTQIGRPADERLLQRALELELRAGPESERSSLVLIWYQVTDAVEATRERHELEDRWYRERGEEIWVAEKRSHLAIVEFRAGNWERARTMIDESCAAIEPVGPQGPLAVPYSMRAKFDAHTGRTEEARSTLLPILEAARARPGTATFTTFYLETLGFAALTEGDLTGADHAFTELEAVLEAVGVTVPLGVRSDADHVEAAVGLGDLDRARHLLGRFERRAASMPRRWTQQTLPRVQALVAAAEGDTAGALTLLNEAPVHEDLPFEHARNLLTLGTLQRRARQRRAAADSLTAAAEIFDRLGSPDWARRTRDELARVGLRRGTGDELTETERRIAELAASGLTNREVASVAFVSPKTVEANLARVYRKLGIRSRAELGAAMTGDGGPKT